MKSIKKAVKGTILGLMTIGFLYSLNILRPSVSTITANKIKDNEQLPAVVIKGLLIDPAFREAVFSNLGKNERLSVCINHPGGWNSSDQISYVVCYQLNQDNVFTYSEGGIINPSQVEIEKSLEEHRGDLDFSYAHEVHTVTPNCEITETVSRNTDAPANIFNHKVQTITYDKELGKIETNWYRYPLFEGSKPPLNPVPFTGDSTWEIKYDGLPGPEISLVQETFTGDEADRLLSHDIEDCGYEIKFN